MHSEPITPPPGLSITASRRGLSCVVVLFLSMPLFGGGRGGALLKLDEGQHLHFVALLLVQLLREAVELTCPCCLTACTESVKICQGARPLAQREWHNILWKDESKNCCFRV